MLFLSKQYSMKKPLLILTLGIFGTMQAFSQAASYPNGSTVANFTVTDVNGNTHSLYTYTSQGKYVLLDFFFDTCPPCQQTTPIFNAFYEKYGCNSGDVVSLSINNGSDNNAEVIAFESSFGGPTAHCPAVSSEGGSAAVDNAFGVSAYPTYCLIGPDNKMISNDIWPLSSIASLENAFPQGAIAPKACAASTSLDESGISASVSIFPNPSSDFLNIRVLTSSNENVLIRISDVQGRVLMVNEAGVQNGEKTHTLSVQSLVAGSYFVTVEAGKKFLQKFTFIKAN